MSAWEVYHAAYTKGSSLRASADYRARQRERRRVQEARDLLNGLPLVNWEEYRRRYAIEVKKRLVIYKRQQAAERAQAQREREAREEEVVELLAQMQSAAGASSSFAAAGQP